jgi:hypothetical protein
MHRSPNRPPSVRRVPPGNQPKLARLCVTGQNDQSTAPDQRWHGRGTFRGTVAARWCAELAMWLASKRSRNAPGLSEQNVPETLEWMLGRMFRRPMPFVTPAQAFGILMARPGYAWGTPRSQHGAHGQPTRAPDNCRTTRREGNCPARFSNWWCATSVPAACRKRSRGRTNRRTSEVHPKFRPSDSSDKLAVISRDGAGQRLRHALDTPACRSHCSPV